MTSFVYRAIDPKGKTLKGTVEAASEAEAILRLETTGCSPVSIRQRTEQVGTPRSIFGKRSKTNRVELEFFSRQLGTLLQAGIPVTEAFDAVSRDSELRSFSEILRNVRRQIQGGSTIAEAIASQPEVFPETYVRMVRAAEAGGVVPETLQQLAQMLEEQRETTMQIRSATRYPLVVLGALVISFSVLVGFILPRLASLFTKFDTSIPLPTKMMLGFHVFLRGNWHFIIVAIVAVTVGTYLALKSPKVRIKWDKYKIRIPIFGPILSQVYMERFCQMTRALLNAGVPMLSTLRSVASVIGNRYMNDEINLLRTAVHGGEPMSVRMRTSPAFTHLVAHMTGMGEQSGQLPELLDLCARHYKREIRYKVKSLVSMIEPILTVTIGAVVFFFMLSVFLPIWDTVKFLK
jgi:MSHA biogenesis protein MshG